MLAPTYTVGTPSGGQHRYYTVTPGQVARTTTGRLASQVDTRGVGGCVLAAGSVRRRCAAARGSTGSAMPVPPHRYPAGWPPSWHPPLRSLSGPSILDGETTGRRTRRPRSPARPSASGTRQSAPATPSYSAPPPASAACPPAACSRPTSVRRLARRGRPAHRRRRVHRRRSRPRDPQRTPSRPAPHGVRPSRAALSRRGRSRDVLGRMSCAVLPAGHEGLAGLDRCQATAGPAEASQADRGPRPRGAP